MKKILLASAFVFAGAGLAVAETAYYPQVACAEIVSSEYSTGGGDSAYQMLEILCKDANGKYTTFVTNWMTAAGFLGIGRVFYVERFDYVPYDGTVLKVE